MYSIDKKYTKEIVIQKSKFICILIPINNTNEVKEHLDNIKQEYKGATHYCYAYITKTSQKYSDDGEPSGTAGTPILNVLKRNNLENILAVVIRYFGGIKLGAGGLLRAYTKSITETLNISNIIMKNEGIILNVSVSYENLNSLYKIIEEKYIKEKTYDDNIFVTMILPKTIYNEIKENLNNICISTNEKESTYI